jgi:hypothetical protein
LKKNLFYRQDKPNELTKEGPFSFVLFESPFTSVSTDSRSHSSLPSLVHINPPPLKMRRTKKTFPLLFFGSLCVSQMNLLFLSRRLLLHEYLAKKYTYIDVSFEKMFSPEVAWEGWRENIPI